MKQCSVAALLGVMGLAAVAAGCSISDGTSSDQTPQGVEGTWNCTIESKTTYTIPSSAPPYDGSGSFLLDVSRDATHMTMTRISGGTGPTCPLRATLSTDLHSATLDPGQVCANSVDNQVSFTQGASSLTADGEKLSGTYTFGVNGSTAAGDPLVGSGTASYMCMR